MGMSFLKRLLAIGTTVVLEQIDNDKGHIIRANTILLTHFVECIRADLVEELVVAVVDILITCPMHRQHLLVMTHDLRRCFTVPNSVAGKDDEFHVFVSGLHDDVWICGQHMIVDAPPWLGVFGRC